MKKFQWIWLVMNYGIDNIPSKACTHQAKNNWNIIINISARSPSFFNMYVRDVLEFMNSVKN